MYICIYLVSSLVDSSANWKYSTNVDTASWKENKIEEWGEDYKNKEIKNAGYSVYFRKDITVDNYFTILQLAVQSQSEFIVYVNEIQVYTYLLPKSSNATQYTSSQSLEDVSTYKHIIVPKELLTSSVSLTTLKIAIELHNTADHPELVSSFDILTYITNSKDSMDTVSVHSSRKLQDILPTYTMYAFFNGKIIDFSSIIYSSLSNCNISPDLPTGLFLSSNGILSGTPKEVVNTQYTLSYNYDIYGSSSGKYVFTLQILCYPDICAHIRINRITTASASYEKVIIKSKDGNEIATLIQDNDLNQNYDYYGPIGTWSFELSSTNNKIWNTHSYMIISRIDDINNNVINITKMKIMNKTPEIHYVNTFYSILMKSQWKYNTYDSIPTEWYGSSIDDSTWSTTNGGNPITPTDTNQFFVFRKTINIPSIINQKGFILSYKSLSNTKIYINDHLVAVDGFLYNYQSSTTSSTYIQQTSAGPLSVFDQLNSITISVLIFDKNHDINIYFDASLLMFVDSSLPVYAEFSVSSNARTTVNPTDIIDFDSSTYGIFNTVTGRNLELLLYTTDGYKNITRYCITYGDDYYYAPTAWYVESIYEVYKTNLHSTVNSAFSSSFESKRQCFFLSNVNYSINKLQFTFTNSNTNKKTNNYYISEIEYFVDDLIPESLPSFSLSSNPSIVYDNTTIAVSITNFEYYKDFIITPSLPDGISLDINSGLIYGIIHGTEGTTEYRITGISILDSTQTTIFTIQIESCLFPKTLVNIQLDFTTDDNTVTMSNVNEGIFSHPIYNLGLIHSEEYISCLNPNQYTLKYSGTISSNKLKSSIYINNKYFGYLEFGQTMYLSFKQFVDSSKMPIAYSYDNITPPKHWNTNLFNDNIWSTVPSSSSLPDVPEDSITQYYRIHYTIENIPTNINRFDINISTFAGMILYINGIEIRRFNMINSDTINYNTLATSEYNEYKSIRSIISVFMNPKLLFIGDNIIAIEIHKQNTIIQPSNGFYISLNFLINNDSPTINGEWSLNGIIDEDYPLSDITDGIAGSYVLASRNCVDSIFKYTISNDIMITYNHYQVLADNNYYQSYIPISFKIEASNDNWNTFVELDEINDQDPEYYNLNKEINNKEIYSSYRLYVTKCGEDIYGFADGEMVCLNELNFSYINPNSCKINGWSYALIDEYSYKICPQGYTSNTKRLCTSSGLQTIEGDNICMSILPSEIHFQNTHIIMFVNHEYEQYYTTDANNVILSITPSLPEGITMDTTSRKLYGTPTTVSTTTTYSLSFINKDNIETTYEIDISIEENICESDGIWPQTKMLTYAYSSTCPIGYEGFVKRYCNNKGEWEESNSNECIFSSTPCTGTTYYNGNECEECINGYVTSLNGNNIQCTLCNDNAYVYKNQCVSKDAICTTITIDSSIYPATKVGMIAVVNCTNDNQYGYYHVLCDYISNTPTWSNDIHKDLCYPKPVSIPGKALESLDYSMQLMTTIDDIYSLLESLARTFVNTFKYQLTDLLLTTNYTTNDESINSLLLHVYYGSNIDFYSSSSSSKPQLYINTITSSPTSLFYPESSLTNSITTKNEGDCQYTDYSTHVSLNSYHSYANNDNSYSFTYFCKLQGLDYSLISVLTRNQQSTQRNTISILFFGINSSWINPDTFITLYRSILISITSPITKLQLNDISSSIDPVDQYIVINFKVLFPKEILDNNLPITLVDTTLLKELLSKRIQFKYDSIICMMFSG
ncbi:hypothetical protein WA158_005965 [Blastocystis sp. Blastoise]